MTPEVLEPIAKVDEEVDDDFASLADRLHFIGDVSPERVMLLRRLATPDDVVRLAHREPKRLCELVDGVLVEKTMGVRESIIGGGVYALIWNFVMSRGLGAVSGEAGMFRSSPKQVRMPDVAFFSWSRFPNGVPEEAAPSIAPDLAVEVLSPGNTPGEMERKRRDYFTAGVRLYWEVDIRTRTIDVYTAPTNPIRLDENAILTGGDVLPGFEVKLADLFRVLDEPRKS